MARRGRPVLVVLRGEPGIGKTALVRAIVDQAARLGFRTADATAHQDDRLAPMASIGPALRSGAAPLIDSADFMSLAALYEQPLWLAEQLATLLERRSREEPILLAIDDGQWCDPLTVFIMRVLPRRLIAAPIVWVFSTRDVVGGGPADLIVDAAGPDLPVARLDLGALAEEAVHAIAVDRLGARPDPAVLRGLADAHGNPFLAVQLLEGLFEPAAKGAAGDGPAVSAGLLDGVRRRVTVTSQLCRELLRTAAVIGPEHRLADVADLIGVPAARLTDPLVEAIDAGLLADEGSVVRFRHELLRLAVYEDLPPSGRRALHSDIARHLVARGRGHAAAAPHVLAAADAGDPAAVDVLRKAAHEVLESMPTTSVTFIRQAFELADANDPTRGEIGLEAVSILTTDRQFDEATRFADALIAASVSAELRARVQLSLLPRLWLTDQYTELLERAADPGAPSDLAERLAAYRAMVAAEPIEPAECTDPIASVVATVAAAEAANRDRDHVRTHALFASARARAQGLAGCGLPDAGHLAQRELLALARIDDIDGAVSRLGDSARDDSWQAAQLALLRAQLAYGAGQVEAAAEAAKITASLMAEMCDFTFEPQARLLEELLALLSGENASALKASQPLSAALLADLEGDPRGAAEIVAVLRADHRFPWPEELLVGAAASAHHRGDPRTVRAAAEVLEGLAERNPGVASVTGAKLLVDALTTGDFESALKHLKSTPRLLLAARANEEHGRYELAEGDRQLGLAALDAAYDQYTELGATVPALRTQRLLQAAGARRRRWAPVPQRPDQGWDALTRMERQVALLIADGHSNRSAADELFLSPSTISTHLRAVFRKLDVHSRVQLANVVLHRNDPSAH